MKILLILDRFFPTDHAFLETVYSKLLPEHGHTVICMARTITIAEKKVKWNSIDVYLFNTGKYPVFFWKRMQRIHILIKASILSKKNHFDIVQVRNWEFGALVALVLKMIFGARFVFQRSFPIDENYREDLKGKELSFRAALKKRMLLFLYPRILHRADAILAISSEMKKKMVSNGYNSNRIFPLGLSFDASINPDPGVVNRIKDDLMTDTKKVILYFGKMDPKRNLEFLLDACNQLNREDFIVVFLGGEPADIERLKTYATSLNFRNRVLFQGKVPRDEVQYFIALSYLTVSPIPPIERFIVASPTKLFESMGIGVPVIGNDLPVQRDVLVASHGGICIPYQTEKFAEAISAMLDHPELREEMGQNARRYVLANYTYDSMVGHLEKIYYELVHGVAT